MPQTVDRKMVRSWTEELEAVDERLSVHFARSEVRERAQDYLRGLLSETERKNSWQLAEVAGNATPYGIQHLLGRANWDAEAVRDELREYVGEHLCGEESVLIVDETGFIKKGDKSVGVKRQYTGTAGKRENCQVGVFLAYASERGQGFIDRELYLPEEWASDEHRRERAGVPEEVGMRTKPELAKEMLLRALEAGVKAEWVLADSVYGDTRRLGMLLQERGQPYVLAVSGKAYVWAGLRQHRIGEVLEVVREGGLVPEDGSTSGLQAPLGRERLEGAAPLRLGEAAAQSAHAGRLPEMALGAPIHRGSAGAQRLHGLRPPRRHAGGAGEGGGQSLESGDRI